MEQYPHNTNYQKGEYTYVRTVGPNYSKKNSPAVEMVNFKSVVKTGTSNYLNFPQFQKHYSPFFNNQHIDQCPED